MTKILLICIAVQAATLIWAQCQINDLRMRNTLLEDEKEWQRTLNMLREVDEVHTWPKKDWPPYMDFPRKSSVNVCAGCVHEATNKGSFPCDECKRKLKGEHDMFVEKVKEK